MSISIEKAPRSLDREYSKIITQPAKDFLCEFVNKFEEKVEKLWYQRDRRRVEILEGHWKPKFRKSIHYVTDDWKISPIPERIKNRKLDLGDVSPAHTAHFIDALYADVQGIQVDFDDGHCPTWRNTILGIYNVTMAVHSLAPKGPANITDAPILWLRPRAFNMIEHNCMVDGKEVSGPLFDFALLMFHNAKILHELKIGPYFYLSKIEDPAESALWNEIFEWTQSRLLIPHGTIKCCILIENILAAFSMDDILFSVKDHTIGLNCGIWDYSASIISKFGNRKDYLIPDRNKYVNVTKPFLSAYMRLVVATCHRRGALATGGMAAQILSTNKGSAANAIVDLVRKAKEREIDMGVDGFMVYDIRLVPHMNQLWTDKCGNKSNQVDKIPAVDDISELTLLDIPKGGVTINGLKHNITVALLFIYHWFSGSGIFFYKGAVEDSATAEISRSQLWQWIRFKAPIEDHLDHSRDCVTRQLVYDFTNDVMSDLKKSMACTTADFKRLLSARYILFEIISAKFYIEYLTTFLNDNHKFRALHNKSDGLESKL